MTDKSYVSMETNVCVVCGKEYDTGSLLIDRRLRESMERHTCTGWGMCEEHEKLRQDDYIALIGVDTNKSTVRNNRINPGDEYRIGAFAHLKKEAWERNFNVPAPDKGVAFVDEEIIKMLEEANRHAS